jgi:hypothetical protein
MQKVGRSMRQGEVITKPAQPTHHENDSLPTPPPLRVVSQPSPPPVTARPPSRSPAKLRIESVSALSHSCHLLSRAAALPSLFSHVGVSFPCSPSARPTLPYSPAQPPPSWGSLLALSAISTPFSPPRARGRPSPITAVFLPWRLIGLHACCPRHPPLLFF